MVIGESNRGDFARALFSDAGHPIIVTDASGTIIDLNAAAQTLLGWSLAELAGRNPDVFLVLLEGAGHFAGLCAVAQGQGQATAEADLVCRDGSRLPVVLAVNGLWPAGGAGSLLGFAATAIDLTESKRRDGLKIESERRRYARQMSERANAAKSRFLAAASHDLRQPLQAMRLFFEVLDARLGHPDDRLIAARIREAMDSGETLLTALSDLANLEAGRVTPLPISLALGPFLAEMAAAVAPDARAKGLRLRVVSTRAVVTTDPDLLGRAVRILVNNTIAYTARGRIVLGVRRRGGHLAVTVCDAGIGMAIDQLEAIFEAFYQIGNSARDPALGLGVGLTVAERTANLLGGAITVRSQLGRGSCFELLIPACG